MSGVIPFVVPDICTCMCVCSTGNVPYILLILVDGDIEQLRLLSKELRLGRGKAKFIFQEWELYYITPF